MQSSELGVSLTCITSRAAVEHQSRYQTPSRRSAKLKTLATESVIVIATCHRVTYHTSYLSSYMRVHSSILARLLRSLPAWTGGPSKGHMPPPTMSSTGERSLSQLRLWVSNGSKHCSLRYHLSPGRCSTHHSLSASVLNSQVMVVKTAFALACTVVLGAKVRLSCQWSSTFMLVDVSKEAHLSRCLPLAIPFSMSLPRMGIFFGPNYCVNAFGLSW